MRLCNYCREPLTEEEEASPALYEGETLCNTCHCDLNHFTCSWCEGCGENEEKHRYVMVFDADEAGVALPGLYRVTTTPYYWHGLIGGGGLDPWAVTWLGFVAECRTDPDGAPCGHLCLDCQIRALEEIIYETRCIAAALRHP